MKEMFNENYLKERYPNHEINSTFKARKGIGAFGDVFSKVFSFSKKGSKIIKKREFVIKEFKTKDLKEKSIFLWNKVYRLGLPTFKFYREYNSKSVIMENLSINNNFCVSVYETNLTSKNVDSTELMKNKIKEILNFEELIDELFNLSLVLAENEFYYDYKDVLFFTGQKNIKSIKLNFVLGDFDKIFYKGNKYHNVYFFYISLRYFLINFVESENEKIYEGFLEDKFFKFIDDNNIKV